MAIAVLMLATLLVAPVAPARASGLRQRASALWLRERGAKATIYVVFAAHRIDTSGTSTIAGAGRIPCRVERGRTFTNMICDGKLTVEELPWDAFSVHPTLERAELVATINRKATRVRWTAKNDRPPGIAPSLPAPEDPRMWVGIERRVTAGGRVMGARVRPRTKLHSADLMQKAGFVIDLPARAGRHRVSFELSVP